MQYSFQNFLQIDSEKRPEVDEVLNFLEYISALISKDPKIEAYWKSFHSLIKVPAEFKVDERTQCSRDVFNEITQITLSAKTGRMVTGDTKLHDQKDTNLCAYFATISALRHQLRKAVGSEVSGKDESRINPKTTNEYWKEMEEKEAKKYAGLKIDEYLKRRDKDEKRFERDMAVMIGCVCPRALSARFKIRQSLLYILKF